MICGKKQGKLIHITSTYLRSSDGREQEKIINTKNIMQITIEHNYVNGKIHGLQRNWYSNGQIFEEVNYVNGKIHGLQRNWYSNGQIFEEVNYVNGKIHGLYRYWHSNGQLSEEVNYVNGQII